jgi:hypothetical protein
LAGVVPQCNGRKLGHVGMFGHRQLPASNAAWCRRRVEQRLHHQHAGLPVHRGVVDLEVVGHLAVVEAVDHGDAPQRAVAVEQLRMQPSDAVFELRLGSGARQGEALHVVVEIDLVVVDPDRVGELQRHRRQLAGEHRHQVQALGQLAPKVVVEIALVAGRQRIAAERPHVLRRLGSLHVQEGPVESTHGLHVASLLG